MNELKKSDIQEMLENQSEIYADCLGTVEDRIAEKIDVLIAEFDIESLLDKKLSKAVNDICRRVYRGVRMQAGNVVKDLGGVERDGG